MNPQEQFWKDNDAYHARSPGDEESNYHFFRKALACADLRWNCSILEFGCGTGANLRALQRCFSSPQLTGIEINQEAAKEASQDAIVHVASIFDPLPPMLEQDLVIMKGVAIHVPPDKLPLLYDVAFNATRRYILLAEYFSTRLEEIEYRGKTGVLWKGPHAYEMLDLYPALHLVDYGFTSKLDRYPQDDINWWLLERGSI